VPKDKNNSRLKQILMGNLIFVILKVIGSLALLMYGMKTMSEGVQKFAGSQLRNILGTMTKNRFTGLLTGVFVTASIQSSTATTVMTVSFVNAGLLTLAQAISVIMGANIGTTVTAWIMAIFGFQINMSDFVFPLFAFAIPLIFSSKSSRKSLGEFIFGFAFMFLGLTTLRENAITMDLGHNPAVQAFIAQFADWGFISILLFLLIGGFMTMAVQSSAAVLAITMILCSQGVLDVYQGVAMAMGENIGTTITSNIAALTANSQARRAALAHFIFNTFGVIWILCIFKPFVGGVTSLVDSIAPNVSPDIAITYYLSAFHTLFNVCNVLILIWFIKPIEHVVCLVIKPKENEDEFRLRYISSDLLSTSELSILQAKKEINLFAERTDRMFQMVKDLLYDHKEETFVKTFSRIGKYENISDRMEVEIANYLTAVSEGRLSSESKSEIRIMMRVISEIESIADSCNNMSHIIKRRNEGKSTFTEEQNHNIDSMFELVEKSIQRMVEVLERSDYAHADINISYNLEDEINNYRNLLKNRNMEAVDNKKYSYQDGVYYIDIISESEKMADYILNVVQAVIEKKV